MSVPIIDESLVIEHTLSVSLAQFALQNLEAVVAIDSCSDEHSSTIPSTVGQTILAKHLKTRFTLLGAQVDIDDYSNVIAHYPAQGYGETQAPLVFMIHLDTAMGTQALPCLNTLEEWDGSPLSFSTNQSLVVSTKEYPTLSQFLGHTMVYGSGNAPFGLDDKLGLTHLLSLAWLIQNQVITNHPPLYLIARPDEEIGRDDALIYLANQLSKLGVKRGYTVDGIESFEVNIANFNAATFGLTIPSKQSNSLPSGLPLTLKIKGVNTHGATAYAEGHRSALRFACELWKSCQSYGVRYCNFIQDPQRDCDGELVIWVPDLASAAKTKQTCQTLIEAHVNRGAQISFHEYILSESEPHLQADLHLELLFESLHTFMFTSDDIVLWAEDSKDWQGYTQPFSLVKSTDNIASENQKTTWTLHFRIRDFDPNILQQRIDQLVVWSEHHPIEMNDYHWHHQYQNMESRLTSAPELITWARAAAQMINQEVKILPIRGGTGIDPFLDQGILLANLGTGYFAPESEKECTSIEMMVAHALWIAELVQVSATHVSP